MSFEYFKFNKFPLKLSKFKKLRVRKQLKSYGYSLSITNKTIFNKKIIIKIFYETTQSV